jgi:stage III sporulation protein SpoIIIAA
MIQNLKQLQVTIEKLIEAQEKVDNVYWEYSPHSKEDQQEAKDMLDFRMMQFESRTKFILDTYFKEN